jgi:hypothetical protein
VLVFGWLTDGGVVLVIGRGWRTALVLLVALGLAGAARAQSPDDDAGAGEPGVRDLELEVARFGPGGLIRAGSWGGVLVEVRDRGLRQREIVLRASVEDRDGDRAWYERVVATNPGFAQSFWLYLRVPHNAGDVVLSAHEALEVPVIEDDPPGLAGFEAGRVLAVTGVESDRVARASEGFIAVMGPRDFGIGRYGNSIGGDPFSAGGHELSRVATGLGVDEIPDRWQGLAPINVLLWGHGEAASPAGLAADQARAVREWVIRGGHLVIVLPPAGGVWLSAGDNPLIDLMPATDTPLRREGVSYEGYRPLLTRSADAALPASGVVHSFRRAPDADRDAFIPVLAGPGGDVVVARRIVGSGMVTLIGLDLGAPALRSAALPDPESFWHRVIGRRGEVFSGEADLTERLGEDAARSRASRDPVVFDADFEEQIDKSRRAAAGVLLGFVVFAVYWLVAGPVGFWALTKIGWRRHAWVGFAVAAMVFTGIAWTGAAAIRPSRIEVEHLTFLDHVYGQPVQRGRGWASVLIPWYGQATVSIGDGETDPTAERLGLRSWHQLLAPWSPVERLGGLGGFPDSRGYRVDARAPSALNVPARSTVKQFGFDWVGAPAWAMPTPVGLPGQTTAPELEIRGDGSIDGVLMHRLPGALEDVVLIWVTGQRSVPPGGTTGRGLSAQVRTTKLIDPWPADQRLDLLASTVGGESGETYLRDLLASGRRLGRAGSGGTIDERLTALSLFGQLPPPDLAMNSSIGQPSPLATRTETHGLDLSRWFTQPCLIVIGHLVQTGDAAGGPVPVRVDGRIPEASGRTVIRWVYPMRGDPPGYLGASGTP